MRRSNLLTFPLECRKAPLTDCLTALKWRGWTRVYTRTESSRRGRIDMTLTLAGLGRRDVAGTRPAAGTCSAAVPRRNGMVVVLTRPIPRLAPGGRAGHAHLRGEKGQLVPASSFDQAVLGGQGGWRLGQPAQSSRGCPKEDQGCCCRDVVPSRGGLPESAG